MKYFSWFIFFIWPLQSFAFYLSDPVGLDEFLVRRPISLIAEGALQTIHSGVYRVILNRSKGPVLEFWFLKEDISYKFSLPEDFYKKLKEKNRVIVMAKTTGQPYHLEVFIDEDSQLSAPSYKRIFEECMVEKSYHDEECHPKLEWVPNKNRMKVVKKGDHFCYSLKKKETVIGKRSYRKKSVRFYRNAGIRLQAPLDGTVVAFAHFSLERLESKIIELTACQ